MDSKKKKKSGFEFRAAKKKRDLLSSASTSKKITCFYSNKCDVNDLEVSSEKEKENLNETEDYEMVVQQEEEIEKIDIPETEIEKHVEKKDETTIKIDVADKVEKSDENEINMFCKPSANQISTFFSFHPIQPHNTPQNALPFSENIFFSDVGNKFNRRWLTFDEKNQMLYCSICLVYRSDTSKFQSGFNDWRHITQRVKEHEHSKHHIFSAEAYMQGKQEKSVLHLLFGAQLEKRKKEVFEKRCVLLQIIEVIKLIGKQGLPYRGDKSEAAYKLDDSSLNHGNFLEIILLLSNTDNILKLHVQKAIEQSKKFHELAETKGNKKYGRGSLVTFLSSTTVTNIIQHIGHEIKSIISNQIKEAKMFSVMMDTTMDLSSYDQCSIVLRYVIHDEVCERVIGLKHVTSTSGQSLFDTLRNSLDELNLSLENCVANSFDGAANMCGQYKGVSAKLSEIIANHVHTWCYAHVLNLVISDTTQCLTLCVSFFSCVQEAYVFFKDSYKRFAVYEKEKPSLRLASIGATRWRSKNDAIVKIFGRIDFWINGDLSPENQYKFVYIELLLSLYNISNCNQFNSKARNDALSLLKKFCSFETVLVAMMFLQIFKITTPLSDYLQTPNLDFVQAYNQISCTYKCILKVKDNFDHVMKAAKNFVNYSKSKIENYEDQIDIEVEEQLPIRRKRFIKRMPGELAQDEYIIDDIDRFRVMTFNYTLDTILKSIETRFLMHKELYLELECFDPRRFKNIRNIDDIPSNALKKICQLLPDIDGGKLREELISFATSWPSICKIDLQKAYDDLDEISVEDEWSDADLDKPKKCSKYEACNGCLKCALRILTEFNMYSIQYKELYIVYKYLLTLPLTQVTCERSFSKLKLLKTRLRATISQDNLENLFLMQCERDILNQVDGNRIIDKMCSSSQEINRLLSL